MLTSLFMLGPSGPGIIFEEYLQAVFFFFFFFFYNYQMLMIVLFRYKPEVGDIIVGRVIEVEHTRLLLISFLHSLFFLFVIKCFFFGLFQSN